MKRFLAFILALALLSLTVAASDASLPRLVDEADILTPSEEDILLDMLNEVSENRECDVVIVTLSSLDGYSATAAADDFFDYNGYGYGPGDDGILFLISMGEREFATSTYGYGIDVFSDYRLIELEDIVVPLLSDGEYYEAFMKYILYCDACLEEGVAEEEYYSEGFVFEPMWVLIAIVIGVVVALIYTGTLKAQLNNVQRNDSASSYMLDGSLNLTVKNDMFLYRNISRTPRPKDSGSSSSGSSVHRSSSGRSHGGRSGSF